MKYLTTAWRNIRRSPYQALAAILIMTLTFLVVSFFVFVLVGSSKVINFFESVPEVNAFFKNEASQEDINELENQLSKTGKIASLKFVSKEEAVKIYKEQNKDDPILIEFVTAEVLPASFKISTYNVEDLKMVSETLKKSSIVDQVIYQEEVVSKLKTWTSAIRKIGISLIILLSLVSVFIMVTIIGIKISQKKDDIEIMRLIGATSWYVRLPFIVEGIFYASIGAFIGWVIASASLLYASPFLETFLKGIPVLPVPFIALLELLAMELILAVLLGILSSFLAVLRYLK